MRMSFIDAESLIRKAVYVFVSSLVVVVLVELYTVLIFGFILFLLFIVFVLVTFILDHTFHSICTAQINEINEVKESIFKA